MIAAPVLALVPLALALIVAARYWAAALALVASLLVLVLAALAGSDRGGG